MGDGVSADGLRLLRLIGDTPEMRELSVAEQRYQAVLAVVSDGETVPDVAARFGVSRKTVHDWLARYEAGVWRTQSGRPRRPDRHERCRGDRVVPDPLRWHRVARRRDLAALYRGSGSHAAGMTMPAGVSGLHGGHRKALGHGVNVRAC
jgi:transposase-like protein